VARLVHARSARRGGPLAELLAGSRPDVDEAEALGPGGDRMQRAEGGTLAVHEVGRLGPLAQGALLRALDERSGEEGTADVRLVATTSLDLERLAQAGRFRDELLYRLNVLALAAPTLDERREDLAELARTLLEQVVGPGRPAPRLGAPALEVLRGRSWPGGLAQLRGTLETALRAGPAAAVLGPEPLDAGAATAPSEASPASGDQTLAGAGVSVHLPDRTLRSAEEALIRRVLAETEGNKLRSAEILGIHRTTLYHKLREYGLGP
jgi:DNA-binding NtrC family response regulator